MKKTLTLLFIFISLGLFISCSQETLIINKDIEPNYLYSAVVTVDGLSSFYEDYNGIYYLKGGEEDTLSYMPESYKLYDSVLCTNAITDENTEDHPFYLEMNGTCDSVSVVSFSIVSMDCSFSPAQIGNPYDVSVDVLFKAGDVIEGSGFGGTITVEFVKDISLTCLYYNF